MIYDPIAKRRICGHVRYNTITFIGIIFFGWWSSGDDLRVIIFGWWSSIGCAIGLLYYTRAKNSTQSSMTLKNLQWWLKLRSSLWHTSITSRILQSSMCVQRIHNHCESIVSSKYLFGIGIAEKCVTASVA